jgi:A/G-specific adenine glycosylase
MPQSKQKQRPHAKTQSRKAQTPVQFRRRVTQWFARNARDLPWRGTTDPYAILVSEIMCQQTQVATVIPYFQRWMLRFPNIKSLAAAAEPEVMSHWQGLGYYSRARNLHRAAKSIPGNFPTTLEEIQSLPGVGRYTAGAIAAFAYDKPVPLVDANIARLLSRLFAIRDPIDSAVGQSRLWHEAARLQPSRSGRAFNAGLMEIGALICIPRNPRCPACPISDFCAAFASNTQRQFPVKKIPPRPATLTEHCALIIRNRQILLQHQTGPRWRGLWKLPPIRRIPQRPPDLLIEYPFTHHKITLSVYRQPAPRANPLGLDWHPLAGLAEVPLAAAHRRALDRLLRLHT